MIHYGDSLSWLSLASSYTLKDFPIFSLHMASEGAHPGQPAQAAHPNSIQNGTCAVCRCVQGQGR